MSPTVRELAHRSNDGINVTLSWHPPSGTVTVRVTDHRAAASFEFDPPAGEALQAFHHPYVYAAARGVSRAVPLVA
jgi:hypothetical protein